MASNRLERFASIFGGAWITGRYLLPRLRVLGMRHYDVVLDLACGESPYRGFFIAADKYIRMDRAPADPEVIDADMRSIPLPDHSVNLTLLSQAISDVPDPMEVLREVARITAPRGQVLVFESMCYPEHDMPNDYYRIMPAGLSWLAKHSGFEVTECAYLGGLFNRCASLWNSQCMGYVSSIRVLRPLAAISVAMCNVVCHAMDKLFMRCHLAPDYLSILQFGDGDTHDHAHEASVTHHLALGHLLAAKPERRPGGDDCADTGAVSVDASFECNTASHSRPAIQRHA